jgi:hypothetical protein
MQVMVDYALLFAAAAGAGETVSSMGASTANASCCLTAAATAAAASDACWQRTVLRVQVGQELTWAGAGAG